MMMDTTSISSVANLFRNASDDDTRDVLNGMSSNRSTSSLDHLHFYVVPSTWMEKAWPILMGNNHHYHHSEDDGDDGWKRDIGKINNNPLLTNDGTGVPITSSSDSDNEEEEEEEEEDEDDNVDDDDDDDEDDDHDDDDDDNDDHDGGRSANPMEIQLREAKRAMKKRCRNKNKKNMTKHSMTKGKKNGRISLLRRDLEHERDFCLLGSHTWRLVLSIFGLDDGSAEVSCRCIFPSAQDNTLAVVLYCCSSEDPATRGTTSTRGDTTITTTTTTTTTNTATTTTSAATTTNTNTSTSAPSPSLPPIQLLIPVPPSGRFAYEKVFSSQSNNAKIIIPQNGHSQRSTDVVSEDDEDPNNTQQQQQQQQQQSNTPIVTGDDHQKDQEDLQHHEQHQQHQQPILLLPPSTTASPVNPICDDNNNTNNDNHADHEDNDLYPSYTSMQQIDIDDQPQNQADTNGNDQQQTVDQHQNHDYNTNTVSTTTNSTTQQETNYSTWKPYGSGLGNLGNTCFMNSTLQCLAHTDTLRWYFISGAYERDLNRGNPLGTGGDLATQFAHLLTEMWGTPSPTTRRDFSSNNYNNTNGYSNNSHSYTSSVVYPRNFKYTLGKHAEQFVGYDQHDSQELATYLLDALHEDTNRVTNKPYIEKPEQGEDEPDHVAANKAWDLNLKREDSRVLQNFTGQVKSRVQCSEEGCKRISTTFDPFMYLSVPIPGSTERTLQVTFVPLDYSQRNRTLSITLSKTTTIKTLLERVGQQITKQNQQQQPQPQPPPPQQQTTTTISAANLCAVDVWNHEVYNWYNHDDNIDKIGNDDVTFVFQLRSIADIQKMEKHADAAAMAKMKSRDAIAAALQHSHHRSHRFKLDVATITRLNGDWMGALEQYVRDKTQFDAVFDHKRPSSSEQLAFYQKLETFIDLCSNDYKEHKDTAKDSADFDKPGIKRSREDSPKINSHPCSHNRHHSLSNSIHVTPADEKIQVLKERSDSDQCFCNVRSLYDLGILDFSLGKLRKYLLDLHKGSDKSKFKDGILIQLICRKVNAVIPATTSYYSSTTTTDKTMASPLIVRIPSNMTVHGLRQELAQRLLRSLNKNDNGIVHLQQQQHHQEQQQQQQSQQPNAVSHLDPEISTVTSDNDHDNGHDVVTEFNNHLLEDSSAGMDDDNVSTSDNRATDMLSYDAALLIMRQIPLSYNRKNATTYKSTNSCKTLGKLERVLPDNNMDNNEVQSSTAPSPIPLASPTDEDEQQLVSEMVGPKGTVFLDWPLELCERVFDVTEYEAVDNNVLDHDNNNNGADSNRPLSVLDCVEKYCQMELLEESEMWYCNRCKNHVQAWKQFHLYRTPPYLIVHLKRFHYSATTHRRNKINTFIDFPLSGLDLTNHVSHWTESEKPVYDCYAVSNHYGGLGGGHYTAYALNDDGVWCHYDDSRVTSHIDHKEVVSEAAYVLYYRRRDVLSSQDYYLAETTEQQLQQPAVVQDPEDPNHHHHVVVGMGNNVLGMEGRAVGSEVSSSNDAQVGDDDDMDVDETDGASRGSSKTCSSPMGSIDDIGEVVNDEDDDYDQAGGGERTDHRFTSRDKSPYALQ